MLKYALYTIGLIISGWGVYCVFRAKRAARWPAVTGRLEDCELIDESDVDGTSYRVKVRYSYEVLGDRYIGDRIGFGYTGSNNYARHSMLYRKLTEIESIDVFFNPSDPQQSVLKEGIKKPPWHFIIFGLLWLLFSIGFTNFWESL